MQVVFDKRFTKDARGIRDATLKQKVRSAIERIEQAESLSAISQLRKLQGHPTAYRMRVGDYRIGLFVLDRNIVELVRVLHRKDIYESFP